MLQLASFLGLFLLCGIVSQAIGFYLTFLLLPIFVYGRRELSSEMCKRFRQLAFGLFLLWAVFPLSNFYNSMFIDTALPFKTLMKSHFSSSVGITALFLFLFSMKDIFRYKTRSIRPRLELQAPPGSSLLLRFVEGLLFASFFLCVYLLFEQVKGVDFLGRAFPDARQMAGGLYRVSGFYGHPLTLAGVGVSFFGFISYLFMQNAFPHKRWHLFFLMLMSAYFVFASGGRIAALIVMALAFFMLMIKYMTPRRRTGQNILQSLGIKLGAFLVCVGLCAFIFYKTGLMSRFSGLSTVENNPDFERLTFWRVHWQIFLDHPWFGQGLAFLNAFKRNEYYDMMGFASLQNKYPAHNMFLEILSNVGILGFIGIVFGLLSIAKSMQSPAPNTQIYVRALFLAFVLNLINGLTQNVFFDSSVMYIYLSLILLILWTDVNENYEYRK